MLKEWNPLFSNLFCYDFSCCDAPIKSISHCTWNTLSLNHKINLVHFRKSLFHHSWSIYLKLFIFFIRQWRNIFFIFLQFQYLEVKKHERNCILKLASISISIITIYALEKWKIWWEKNEYFLEIMTWKQIRLRLWSEYGDFPSRTPRGSEEREYNFYSVPLMHHQFSQCVKCEVEIHKPTENQKVKSHLIPALSQNMIFG